MFIFCSNVTSTRDAATQLNEIIDDIVELLQAAEISSIVLSHGIMPKFHTGFIVLEYYGPLPSHVLNKLNTNQDISDFVIYDAPCMELEQRAIQQALLLEAKRVNEANLEGEANYREVPAPPEPPAEFVLLSVPVPLLSPYDERWIARACGPDGTGVLIYEHLYLVVFLLADEAIAAQSFLSTQARYLCQREEGGRQ
jgi:hypothetical protein